VRGKSEAPDSSIEPCRNDDEDARALGPLDLPDRVSKDAALWTTNSRKYHQRTQVFHCFQLPDVKIEYQTQDGV
jgi:hypothetical protein